MEFDVKYPNNQFAIGLSPSTSSSFHYNIGLGLAGTPLWRTWKPTSSTTNTGVDSNISASTGNYHTAKFVYDNGTCSIYANNTLIITYTEMDTLYENISKTIGLQTWGSGTFYIKNVKVKQL